uniref:Uncharacterized protein ORF-c10_020 n=1 Tax=Saccharolobus solfataricus TaxID=2287 RepID=Q9UX99_SACSO|nr:hypothetical protein [Saccharolobus solfataricus P2]
MALSIIFSNCCPLLYTIPSFNFSYLALSVVSLPLIIISAPSAPAFIILLIDIKAALLKWYPFSKAIANLNAITLALSSGFSTFVIVICGFSRPKTFSKICASCFIFLPPLPIIIEGLPAYIITLVPIGVFKTSTPAYSAL